MKKDAAAKSALPIYIFGLSFLAYALFLPFFRYYHYLLALFTASVCSFVCQLIIIRGQSPSEIFDPALDKDSRAKNIMASARGQLSIIASLAEAIGEEYIRERVLHIIETAEKTLSLVSRGGSLSAHRRFITFYFPLTLELLSLYQKLSEANDKSAGALLKLSRLEGLINDIHKDFEKQALVLKGELEADFSANIASLEARLVSLGLGKEAVR